MASEIVDAVSQIIKGTVTPKGAAATVEIYDLARKDWESVDAGKGRTHALSLEFEGEQDSGATLDIFFQRARFSKVKTTRDNLRMATACHEIVEAGLVELDPKGREVAAMARQAIDQDNIHPLVREHYLYKAPQLHIEGVVAEIIALSTLTGGNLPEIRRIVGKLRGKNNAWERDIRLSVVDHL